VHPLDPNWAQLFLNDLKQVLPECILVVGMCVVILVPFIRRRSMILPTWAAGLTLFAALLATIGGLLSGGADDSSQTYGAVFHAALMIDPFSQMFKILLLLFAMLIMLQWLVTSPPDVDALDVPDFLCLLLGATTGMMLMASANNLLMIVIAIETASLPSFALAGFRKYHRAGSEGALKYVLFGAASSAIMMYGMSLLYGCAGTISLEGVGEAAKANGITPLFAIGIAAMLVGIGFKLSAVPMHFWCPDVFQGAPVVVTTFLSVASKGAAVVLLLRVLSAFAVPSHGFVWSNPMIGFAIGVALLGTVTAVWGNLLAYHQTHLRRLLAYSSIAHAGYMIMGVSVVLIADKPHLVSAAILFYLFVYMFMNLGAFTVGALIAARTGSEDIRDYQALIHRSPALVVLMVVFLFSLVGLPPVGGFFAKVFLMTAMMQLGWIGAVLIAVLLINTVVSLYYYLRPVYYMLKPHDADRRPAYAPGSAGLAVLVVCALMLLWTGIFPNYANRLTTTYATVLTHSNPPTDQLQTPLPDGDKSVRRGEALLTGQP
jgi:NADH-quinone oxidoreductase subunit N